MNTPKSLITAALLATLLAGCASDALVAPEETAEPLAEAEAIGFGSIARAKTRVSHEESAALLGNKFYVFGTKTKGTDVSPVFDNYLVEYSASSAGSTATNTHDWEYAGKVSKKGAIQGVKYWDFSAERFDFVAAAGLASDELIKNTTDGVRVNITDVDAMTKIYVADRIMENIKGGSHA